MSTYTLIPGSVAALLYLQQPGDQQLQAMVYLSKENGVVYGVSGTALRFLGLPEPVEAAINKHFETVFALEHETWKGPGPSPRSKYCDTVAPWSVKIGPRDEEDERWERFIQQNDPQAFT